MITVNRLLLLGNILSGNELSNIVVRLVVCWAAKHISQIANSSVACMRRCLMGVYNSTGAFPNANDDLGGLRQVLTQHFANSSVEVVGSVPAGWPNNELIGDRIIVPPATDEKTAQKRSGEYECYDWWFCHKPLEK